MLFKQGMKEWERRSFLRASKTRTQIVEALLGQEKTPQDLAQETGISLGNVSRALGELLKAELVVCLTPGAKKGRYYKATELGAQTLEFVTSVLCPQCHQPMRLFMEFDAESGEVHGRCLTEGCPYRESVAKDMVTPEFLRVLPGIAKVKREPGHHHRYIVEKVK